VDAFEYRSPAAHDDRGSGGIDELCARYFVLFGRSTETIQKRASRNSGQGWHSAVPCSRQADLCGPTDTITDRLQSPSGRSRMKFTYDTACECGGKIVFSATGEEKFGLVNARHAKRRPILSIP
jgi:hypothetical protein